MLESNAELTMKRKCIYTSN